MIKKRLHKAAFDFSYITVSGMLPAKRISHVLVFHPDDQASSVASSSTRAQLLLTNMDPGFLRL